MRKTEVELIGKVKELCASLPICRMFNDKVLFNVFADSLGATLTENYLNKRLTGGHVVFYYKSSKYVLVIDEKKFKLYRQPNYIKVALLLRGNLKNV